MDFTRRTIEQAAIPTHISTLSIWSVGYERAPGGTGTPASTTWVANLAIYCPIILPFNYPVRRMFWLNGTSVASTNMDIGVFTADGTRLYSSGSTAGSGATTVQYVTPSTPFMMYADTVYYIGYSNSGTTNRSFGASVTAAAQGRFTGILEQASALPLPATATFASLSSIALFPVCGITRTASGF